MIEITYLSQGETSVVKKVGGTEQEKQALEQLGIRAGSIVTVVSIVRSSIILSVKDVRIALNKDLAKNVLV